MKKFLFLSTIIISSTVFFFGCQKSPSQSASLVGNWALTDTFPPNNTIVNLDLNIIDNSHYTLSGSVVGGTALASTDSGTYSITSDLVTFTSTGSTSPCINYPGRYMYGVYSNYLSLLLYTDNCNFGLSPRADYMASNNWIKQ